MLENALQRFSPGERLTLYLFATLLCLSTLVMLANLDARASVVVPTTGGTLIEGETGPARFINPLLSISQADQDLTALVYSGLARALPDGSIVADLAESYSVSQDGLTYTFTLRSDLQFHDGTPITADDVIFTIQQAQDPSINSPHRADWTGVVTSSPDPTTIVFTLPHAYAPFIENTTLGILPKHLWQSIDAEEFPFTPLNTHPVGSGPYKISKVVTDSTGSAERYDLVPFSHYTLGTPYLSRISFVFFASQEALMEALDAGDIDAAAGISTSELANIKRSDVAGAHVPLPRTFGVFFNQSHNAILSDLSVRAALDAAIDKKAVVAQALSGHGVVLDGPIPPGLLGDASPAMPITLTDITERTATSTTVSPQFAQKARTILQKGGWTFDTASPPAGGWKKNKKTLAFTLSTADQPELVATARALAAAWQAAGIDVGVQVYPLAQLNTNVIRPRAYDALLFGEVVGPELDLYAFWHSSQRNDPGLNLAMYANAKTDALLGQARATTERVTRDKLYEQFATTLIKDVPAIFLYAPDFLYVVPGDIRGIALGALTVPADRFANVYQWYTDTEYVWAIFAPKEVQKN